MGGLCVLGAAGEGMEVSAFARNIRSPGAAHCISVSADSVSSVPVFTDSFF
jgi:hypothetical protein